MASIILADGIQFLNGLEANRASIIPDIAEPLWARDTNRLYVGDGATAGAILVGRYDDVVEIDWTGHGRTLPASGIDSVFTDGTTLTDAQAALPTLPSFHVVSTPNVNKLGIINSGIAFLPATNLVAGQMYWLDPTAPNVLTDTEPTLSVPVCEVLRTVGAGAWVRFIDYRAWDRAEAGTATGPAPTVATHWRLKIYQTHAKFNGFVTNDIAAIDEIEFRATAGVAEAMPSASAFTSSQLNAGYAPLYAFDGSVAPVGAGTNSLWHTLTADVFPHTIGTVFGTARAVASVWLRASLHANHFPLMPRDFDIENSDDAGATWYTVKEVRGENWISAGAEREIII